MSRADAGAGLGGAVTPVVGLAALAFLLRLWILRSIPVIETDGVRYVAIARQLQESGSPFDPLFPPLYPLWIAVLQPLVGDYELAGRLVSALFGAGLILPAYALARALLGHPAALLSALLLAIHPGLAHSAAAVLSEATYTFFVVLGVWMVWGALGAGKRALLAPAGLVFGLAYLARPEGFLYLIGLIGLALIAGARGERRRETAAWAGAALAAFLVVGGPYLLYLRGVFGYWTLSGKIIHNLVLDLDATAVPGQTDIGLVASHGGALARRVLENAFLVEKYALPELFPGLLILFVLPGLLARLRGSDWAAREGMLLAAALPPLVSLPFHIDSRIFLPSMPFLLPLAAAGILATGAWLARGMPAAAWSAALVVTVAAALAPYTLRPILRPDPGARLYRQAAHWVATTQPPGAVLLDRKPFVAFYSARRFAPLGRVSPDELPAVARRAGARLVILDSRVLEDRPALVPLLYGPPPPGLELLQEFDAGPNGRLRILGVVGP